MPNMRSRNNNVGINDKSGHQDVRQSKTIQNIDKGKVLTQGSKGISQNQTIQNLNSKYSNNKLNGDSGQKQRKDSSKNNQRGISSGKSNQKKDSSRSPNARANKAYDLSPNKVINQSQGRNMHLNRGNVQTNNNIPTPKQSTSNITVSYPMNVNFGDGKYYQPPNLICQQLQVGHGSQLPLFSNSKTSNKKFGVVQSFAANTNTGLVRKANEDRIAIILNVIQPIMKEPKMPEEDWPKIQIFAVYDGHGGNQCAEYLNEHLHNNIILHPKFPNNVQQAIMEGSSRTD